MLLKINYIIILACLLFTLPSVSQAYVGPGTGLSAIGSIIAFIGTVFLLLVGFLWYPIKRLIKRKKIKSYNHSDSESGGK